jgi:hypothetical protein
MTNSGNAIKNITEYHTAQALAGIAEEIFRKDLNPIAPSALKAANTDIENDLNQLKARLIVRLMIEAKQTFEYPW